MYSNEKTTKDSKRLKSMMEKIISPKLTLFGMKNFYNAVDFHPKEMICKNTWSRDLTSSHIRNKRLLDLPYTKPKCCADIYNITKDREKQKRMKRFNLSRPVRLITSSREEEVKLDVPECVPRAPDDPKVRTVIVPECLVVPESDSDSDEFMVEGNYKSGSVCECPMRGKAQECGKRLKMLRAGKRGETSSPLELDFCRDKIKEEMKRHKLGEDFELRLKKVFN